MSSSSHSHPTPSPESGSSYEWSFWSNQIGLNLLGEDETNTSHMEYHGPLQMSIINKSSMLSMTFAIRQCVRDHIRNGKFVSKPLPTTSEKSIGRAVGTTGAVDHNSPWSNKTWRDRSLQATPVNNNSTPPAFKSLEQGIKSHLSDLKKETKLVMSKFVNSTEDVYKTAMDAKYIQDLYQARIELTITEALLQMTKGGNPDPNFPKIQTLAEGRAKWRDTYYHYLRQRDLVIESSGFHVPMKQSDWEDLLSIEDVEYGSQEVRRYMVKQELPSIGARTLLPYEMFPWFKAEVATDESHMWADNLDVKSVKLLVSKSGVRIPYYEGMVAAADELLSQISTAVRQDQIRCDKSLRMVTLDSSQSTRAMITRFSDKSVHLYKKRIILSKTASLLLERFIKDHSAIQAELVDQIPTSETSNILQLDFQKSLTKVYKDALSLQHHIINHLSAESLNQWKIENEKIHGKFLNLADEDDWEDEIQDNSKWIVVEEIPEVLENLTSCGYDVADMDMWTCLVEFNNEQQQNQAILDPISHQSSHISLAQKSLLHFVEPLGSLLKVIGSQNGVARGSFILGLGVAGLQPRFTFIETSSNDVD